MRAELWNRRHGLQTEFHLERGKTMKKILVAGVLLLTMMTMLGCTLITRNEDVIGKYPYEAVYCSGASVVMLCQSGDAGLGVVILFIGMPIDIFFDTVLLPADLIGWGFGLKRSAPFFWK